MGHLGLWEPVSRTAIVIDSILGGGLLNFEGIVIHPPPYVDAGAYESSIKMVKSLRPERLLTAHYDVIERQEVENFLNLSNDFVQRARAAVEATVREDKEVSLASLLATLAPELGPFTSFPNELAGPLRSHVRELVAIGLAEEVPGAEPAKWRWIG
jgi:hypothetical protein